MRDGNEITIKGLIRRGAGEQFIKAFTSDVTTIRVTSGGGLVDEALTIAQVIVDHKLDVIVDGGCVSSCANYIFLSARNKRITQESLVCFHGGPPRNKSEAYGVLLATLAHAKSGSEAHIGEDSEKDTATLLEGARPLVERQNNLFLSLGIDVDFIYPGKLTLPAEEVSSHSDLLPQQPISIMWCPGPSDYNSWNIQGVTFDGPPTPDEIYRLGLRASVHLVATSVRGSKR